MWVVPLALLAAGCCCRRAPCEVAQSPPPAAAAQAPAPAGPETVEQVLAGTRVRDLDWKDMTLPAALAYLRTVTGVAFYLSPEAQREKYDKIRLTLKFDSVTAKAVLEMVTQPFGLTWEVREGAVWIVAAKARTALLMRYYDLRDLVGHGRRFATMEDALAEIRRGVAPGTWDRADVALEGRKGVVVARAPQAVLDDLEAHVARLRRS
jgi:hypothetical protein